MNLKKEENHGNLSIMKDQEILPSSRSPTSRRSPMSTNPFTKAEIEQIVILERLCLYNRCLPCGPHALRYSLYKEGIHPLPSLNTIKRILARNELTHRRTGFYP